MNRIRSRRRAVGLSEWLGPNFSPFVMPIATLLAIVRNFQAYAIRVGKECGPVVRGIVLIKRRVCGLDAGSLELPRDSDDILN